MNSLSTFLFSLLKFAFLVTWYPGEGKTRLWYGRMVGQAVTAPQQRVSAHLSWQTQSASGGMVSEYLALSSHSLEEDVASGTHRVWKDVHQCHCVSHRIKRCQQCRTTDAALFSCGPSEDSFRKKNLLRFLQGKVDEHQKPLCVLTAMELVCMCLPVGCHSLPGHLFITHPLPWHCQCPGSPT